MGGFGTWPEEGVLLGEPEPPTDWEAACWARFGIRRQEQGTQYPEGHWARVYKFHAYQARHGLTFVEMLDVPNEVIFAEVM